jgi:hypothetical protein
LAVIGGKEESPEEGMAQEISITSAADTTEREEEEEHAAHQTTKNIHIFHVVAAAEGDEVVVMVEIEIMFVS